MKATQFVLWGQHSAYANGVPIKIMGGTARECRARMRHYMTLRGWYGLAVLPTLASY